ncbi:M20/M25/M40 family metallo-hydrolase [Sutcliffiella horikoshii]|uniref:M20/M25/M40 family metallo-hydrolase n=1 Tax=Sutcliffiella horikoshii TaxID=79883 RepID=UPI001F2648AA|nr:M20/M25/M40 family metallo-hydrolase [Sutcliffiella horikoshii]MCG1021237.1 Zn-dependent exopeptidase M28 [Sutcliffiella horikoshii]
MKKIMLVTTLIWMVAVSAVSAANGASLVHKTGSLSYKHTQYLSETIGARVAASDQEAQAKAYLNDQFNKMGYETNVQEFSYVRRGSSYDSANVVAFKPGKSEKVLVVGAHYDSVAAGKGSDDNASGVAVMLEAAEVLKKIPTPYSILFVAFGAEEVGLQGSNYFVSQMSAEDIQNTVGMINLDSLAVGDYMYVHGSPGEEGFLRDQALAIADKKKLDLRINEGLNPDYPAGTTGDWSDHAPFKKAGIPIAYFESTNWEIGDLDGYEQTEEYGGIWHTNNDTLEFIQQAYPGRLEERLSTFSTVLIDLLKFTDKTSTSKK